MGSGKEREWREREWGGEGGAEGRDVAVGIYLPPQAAVCPYVMTSGPWEWGNQGSWSDRGCREPGITGPWGRHL